MSIHDFNRGLDDAYMGICRDSKGNIDYEEGLQIGEDIEARRAYEEDMRKAYEEDLKEQEEEYYERLRREGKG